MIDAYNVERSLEGLFNTRGTQVATTDAAETALDFSRESDHVALAPVRLGQGFSQETWIFPRVTAPEPGEALEQALLGADDKTATAPPSIWIVDNRRVRVGFGDGAEFHSFITGEVLRSNQWNHLAVVFSNDADDAGYHLYVNGLPVDVRQEGEGTSVNQVSMDSAITLIGAPSRSFSGLIDEIRLWNRARSEREIRSDRSLRLSGHELGLAAYWRLDEGSGSEIFDQTGNHAPGTMTAGFAATMPLVHSDTSGLAIAGGLLTFAWSDDTPLLFDSAVGNVAMYFRGTDDQFFVAYYKTLTQRARYALNDALGAEAVVGFARSTEAEMDRIRLDVATDPTCTVTIEVKAGDQTIVETWRQVPRAPEGFAKVLNGLAGDRTFVGRGEIGLTAGRADTLTVAGGIHRSLPAGATLFIGDFKAVLATAADQGATELAIRTEVANPTAEPLPVFLTTPCRPAPPKAVPTSPRARSCWPLSPMVPVSR